MIELESGRLIEVVDAQVHLNRIGHVAACTTAMDAVGVDVVVNDEWHGFDNNGIKYPSHPARQGGVRHDHPYSVDAVMQVPDRISYLGAVDRKDPLLAEVIEETALDPSQSGIRIYCGPRPGDHDAFAAGEYDPIFEACATYGVTLMVIVSRMAVRERYDLLVPKLAQFSGTQTIIDHCGIFPLSARDVGLSVGELFAPLERVASMEHVAVKWCRAPEISDRPYPFSDIGEQLRGALDLIGAHRVLWASDHSQTRRHHSWSEALRYIADDAKISDDEKEQVLGGTARRLLCLPKSVVDKSGRVQAEVSG